MAAIDEPRDPCSEEEEDEDTQEREEGEDDNKDQLQIIVAHGHEHVQVADLGGDLVDGVCVYKADRYIPVAQGDFLTELAGKPVTTKEQVDDIISSYRPGDKVQVKFLREGKTYKTDITIGASERDNLTLKEIILHYEREHVRSKTIAIKNFEDIGTITCKVFFEGGTCSVHIKKVTMKDVKDCNLIVKMCIGEDHKAIKPQRSKKARLKKGVADWNCQLDITGLKLEDYKDQTLHLEVKVPGTFSSRLISGAYINMGTIADTRMEGMMTEYKLTTDPGNTVAQQKKSTAEHAELANLIKNAAPGLNLHLFQTDGVCVKTVEKLSAAEIANLKPGDVLVGVAGLDEEIECEKGGFKGHALRNVKEFQHVIDKYQRPLKENNIADRVEVKLISFRPSMQLSKHCELTTTAFTINDHDLQTKLRDRAMLNNDADDDMKESSMIMSCLGLLDEGDSDVSDIDEFQVDDKGSLLLPTGKSITDLMKQHTPAGDSASSLVAGNSDPSLMKDTNTA